VEKNEWKIPLKRPKVEMGGKEKKKKEKKRKEKKRKEKKRKEKNLKDWIHLAQEGEKGKGKLL